jgi:signal transduction histidine kinase
MAEPAAPDVFARAQTRLALLFAGIVIVLVIVSSVFMYLTFRTDIRNAAARTPGDGETESEYVSRSLGKLRWQLVALDGVIVVAVGVGGLLYARRTLKPIRESVAAQRRFVADASHDLRTPLAVMKADFEVALRDPALSDQARPSLVSGLEEVDRMGAMVEDLLTLSRIDARQVPVASERLDLEPLARETTASLRGLAGAAGVELKLDAGGHAPATGDPGHLRRALANIMRNAIEHSPAGSRVQVTVATGARRSEITVTDHGEGIPPEVLAHVFDRFYRGDPSRSRARGGSGLGLAIARWAVRRMGGDVTLASAPGSGTTATIWLPTPRG